VRIVGRAGKGSPSLTGNELFIALLVPRGGMAHGLIWIRNKLVWGSRPNFSSFFQRDPETISLPHTRTGIWCWPGLWVATLQR